MKNKKMNIIVLVGPSSCGKSTTLNIVYQLLLTQGAVSTNRQQEGGNPKDFSDIVEWQGKKIAFFTMGDYSGALVTAIRYYFAQNCDTLICACNNRFSRPFDEFVKHNTLHINKTRQLDSTLYIDNSIANKIVSML